MTMRVRRYVTLVLAALVAFVYARLTGEWGDLAFCAGGAGVLSVVVVAANAWIELAPDGAFRRRPPQRG